MFFFNFPAGQSGRLLLSPTFTQYGGACSGQKCRSQVSLGKRAVTDLSYTRSRPRLAISGSVGVDNGQDHRCRYYAADRSHQRPFNPYTLLGLHPAVARDDRLRLFSDKRGSNYLIKTLSSSRLGGRPLLIRVARGFRSHTYLNKASNLSIRAPPSRLLVSDIATSTSLLSPTARWPQRMSNSHQLSLRLPFQTTLRHQMRFSTTKASSGDMARHQTTAKRGKYGKKVSKWFSASPSDSASNPGSYGIGRSAVAPMLHNISTFHSIRSSPRGTPVQ